MTDTFIFNKEHPLAKKYSQSLYISGGMMEHYEVNSKNELIYTPMEMGWVQGEPRFYKLVGCLDVKDATPDSDLMLILFFEFGILKKVFESNNSMPIEVYSNKSELIAT